MLYPQVSFYSFSSPFSLILFFFLHLNLSFILSPHFFSPFFSLFLSMTRRTICQVRALYNYKPSDPSSISFKEDDIIDVCLQLDSGWWVGW